MVQLAARPFKLREDTHFALLASTALVVGLVCCVALQLDDVVRDLWVNLSSNLKKRFALQGAEDQGRSFEQAASLVLTVSNNVVVFAFACVCMRAAFVPCRKGLCRGRTKTETVADAMLGESPQCWHDGRLPTDAPGDTTLQGDEAVADGVS